MSVGELRFHDKFLIVCKPVIIKPVYRILFDSSNLATRKRTGQDYNCTGLRLITRNGLSRLVDQNKKK